MSKIIKWLLRDNMIGMAPASLKLFPFNTRDYALSKADNPSANAYA